MSSQKRCPRCGETGPATFHIQGNERVGMCANQHKMIQEPVGFESFQHRRMTDWVRRMERSGGFQPVRY